MSQICQKCGSQKVEGWEHGSLCDGCYVQEQSRVKIAPAPQKPEKLKDCIGNQFRFFSITVED